MISLSFSKVSSRLWVYIQWSVPCARVPPFRFFVHGRWVTVRRARLRAHKRRAAPLETWHPGGSSMNGMNLSGKPGMVHPMQMPPTFGHPPMPAIHPRFGTLQLTYRSPAANLASRCT